MQGVAIGCGKQKKQVLRWTCFFVSFNIVGHFSDLLVLIRMLA